MQLAFTFQFFVRDPDGYYIEFCNCQFLESFLHKKMAEEAKKWNFNATQSVLTVGYIEVRLTKITNIKHYLYNNIQYYFK